VKRSFGAELVEGHLAPCGRAGELEVKLGDVSIPPLGRGFDLVEAAPDERLALKAQGTDSPRPATRTEHGYRGPLSHLLAARPPVSSVTGIRSGEGAGSTFAATDRARMSFLASSTLCRNPGDRPTHAIRYLQVPNIARRVPSSGLDTSPHRGTLGPGQKGDSYP
jgi:hypothetical protein